MDIIARGQSKHFEVRLYEDERRRGAEIRPFHATLALRTGRAIETASAHRELLALIRREVNAALDEAERNLPKPDEAEG